MKHLASWLTGYSQKAGRGGGGGRKEREGRRRVVVWASLPTLTAAITGDAMTDKVTPPVIAKFLLCLEVFLPSYLL